MSRVAVRSKLFLAVALLAAPAAAAEVDAERSQVGFQLVTRWGEVVDGRFPVIDGRLERLADGRQRVRISLSAAHVEIIGNARHTYMTRGRGFFEAERHPWVTFESDPFEPGFLAAGGSLPGTLSIRDVQRREAFTVEPAACARPALDCAVVVSGAIDRGQYGMNRWGFAVGRKVYLRLHILVEGGGG